ncbi:hypothetical protein [Caldisalinibacter kiritimatiensis]|uniref:Uncharacterized protein n=1 Tax=Caldisalinibacter kiritimatiensis TaxID=1304284 RepID=R1CWR1_9FIRM|nr:hypothetical protein [Caldisalinibacter kiritimatiensis]EOD01054.1 hypothetical protein L21TH_0890 [Caldisalinibacter kiritimatiensis]
MDITTYIIISIFIFLIGYALGRRVGIKEGFFIGVNTAPILLRIKMQKEGICPLCNNND